MTISARTHALRYRIWAYANPKGWDCTIADIADALDVSPNLVRATLQHAGWTQRIRLASQASYERSYLGTLAAGRNIAADLLAGRIGVDA
jgi:uncharacterized protein YjcR